MKRQLFAIITLGIILSIVVYGQTANYPFVIEPLSEEILRSLIDEFNTINNNMLCNTLNDFGYTYGPKDVCYTEVNQEITDKDKDIIIEMAKETIVKNSKFTGITDKSDLIVEWYTSPLGLSKNVARIIFKNQIYNGIEVENTQITVFADIEKVYRIDEHWYSDIEVPEPLVSENEAKNSLLGKELSYSDTAGNSITYKITDADLQNNADKVIFPLKLPYTSDYDRIEIRLAWKIPVGKEYLSWYIYVDAVTGDELETSQMFQTAGGGPVSSGEEDQTKGLNYLYIALGVIILAIILFFILRKRK